MVGLNGYNLFRKDRHCYINAPSGGGVLIATRIGLSVSQLINVSINVEQIFVEISCLSKNLIVGAFYVPPRENIDIYQQHMDDIDNLRAQYESHEFFIIGDYNLPHTLWYNYSDLSDTLHAYCNSIDNVVQENAALILNYFSFLGFYQYYPIHERKGYTLDLAFSSLQEAQLSRIVSDDYLVPIEVSNHVPVFFQIDVFKSVNIDRVKCELNFDKADYVSINSKLENINWEAEFGEYSLDTSVDKFYSVLNEIIRENVPTKRIFSSSYPPWFSHELISHIINKKKIHKKWLEFNISEDYVEFKRLRALCIRLSKSERQNYITNVENSSSKNIKYFWNYVNKLTSNNVIPEEMFLHDVKAKSKEEVCNLFARNFELVYVNANSNFYHELCISDDVNLLIDTDDIISAIGNMKNSASVGPDSIPACFIKMCKSTISKPLLYLYNLSLRNGHMPSIWKKSYITPVFKAGNKQNVLNYRPISIMGSIAKIFDCIMTQKLTSKCIQFVTSRQHGFVKGRSTLTNLILYSDYIAQSLNRSVQVDSIYLDFAKAFDSVNHGILIYKLFNLGIKGSTLKWIASYLTNRELQVNIKGNFSRPFIVNSGVPQGSHLGPLLFILFINDVVDRVKVAEVLVFADDIKIFLAVNSFYDQVQLQKDLHTIWEWSVVNKLKLNCDKCKVLTFCRSNDKRLNFCYAIDNNVLEKVNVQKDLGVIFESNFTFNQHLNATVSKAFNMLGFVMRSTKEFKNLKAIISIYKSLVRSVLTYASIIWSPHYDVYVSKLNSVQHKFIRFLAFKTGNPMRFDNHDYSQLSLQFNLESIKSLHIRDDLCFVKKSKLLMINCTEVNSLFVQRQHTYNVRGARELVEQFSDKNYVYHSVVHRLRRKWNNLPSNIKCCNSISKFKSSLRNVIFKYY